MAKPIKPHSAARKNAEHYFKRAEQQSDAAGRQTHERKAAAMNKAGAMNIARLREPRLATRAVEKNLVDNPSAEDGAAELALQRKRAPAVRSILRMNY